MRLERRNDLDLRAGHVQSRYDRAPSCRGPFGHRQTFVESFGGRSAFGENVVLSDSDVISRHVGFRSEWAQFLPLLPCCRSFWVLFKEPSGLFRLLARIGEVPIACLQTLDFEEHEKLSGASAPDHLLEDGLSTPGAWATERSLRRKTAHTRRAPLPAAARFRAGRTPLAWQILSTSKNHLGHA